MSPARLRLKEDNADDQKLLKTNDPIFIHTLPSSGSTKTTTVGCITNNTQQPSPPPPVIIYTHSPKVIHTHPRDFRSLVQKLTGYTQPPEETKPTKDQWQHHDQGSMEVKESSSKVTDEHGSIINDVPRLNSCFVDGGVGRVVPPPYDMAGFDPTPFLPMNSTNFLCTPTHQLPFYT